MDITQVCQRECHKPAAEVSSEAASATGHRVDWALLLVSDKSNKSAYNKTSEKQIINEFSQQVVTSSKNKLILNHNKGCNSNWLHNNELNTNYDYNTPC